jgi:hypothetical protein
LEKQPDTFHTCFTIPLRVYSRLGWGYGNTRKLEKADSQETRGKCVLRTPDHGEQGLYPRAARFNEVLAQGW